MSYLLRYSTLALLLQLCSSNTIKMQKSKVKHEANMQKVKDALEESYHHTPHAPHNFKEVMQELRAMQESHGPENTCQLY